VELGEPHVGQGDGAEAAEQHEADDQIADQWDRAKDLQAEDDAGDSGGGGRGRMRQREAPTEAVAPRDDTERSRRCRQASRGC
jgi:hypothetical protein